MSSRPTACGRFFLHLYLCLALLCALPPAHAQAEPRHYVVNERSLDAALTTFARQAGITLSFDPQSVRGLPAPTLEGAVTVEQGLRQLIAGTGLQLVRVSDEDYSLLRPGEPGSGTTLIAPVRVGADIAAREGTYSTPGSAAVVTAEEMRRLPPRNTADVLSGVAGVSTSQSRQNPGVSVNVRGMQDFGRVTVMLDGARQNFQKSGHGSNGSAYLDPELLSSVDVFKGPVSTVGGAGSIAGTVNFRTLAVEDLLSPEQQRGGRLNLNSGDNRYHFSGSAAYAERLNDDVSLLAAISRKYLGDYERGSHRIPRNADRGLHGVSEYTGQEQWSALLKADWRIDAAQRLRVSYVGLRSEYSDSFQDTTMAGMVRGTNDGDMDTLTLGYTLAPADNPLLNLDASLYYTSTRVREQRENAQFYDEFDVRYETHTVGGTLANTAALMLAGRPLAWTVGSEIYYDWTNPSAQSDTSRGIEEKWFTGATPEGERLVASVFTEGSLLLTDRLTLIAGLRYDWYSLQGEGRMHSGRIANPPGVRPPYTEIFTSFDVARHAGQFAPKLTISHDTTDWLQSYISYGEGLRPPALTESLLWGAHVGNMFYYFPNPRLEEERSRNIELGVNLKFDGVLTGTDTLRAKIAWFDTQVEHYIVQAPIMSPIDEAQPVGMGAFAFVNLFDDVRFRGLETQLDYDAGRYFGNLSYTRLLTDLGDRTYDPFPLGSLYGYPDTTFGQFGTGLWYVLPPRHRVLVTSGVRFFDQRLTLGTRYRYEQPTRNPSGAGWLSESIVEAMQTWDVWTSYDANDHLTLRLSVNNLRDTFYTEQNGNTHQIGPGRTVIAGITLRF